MDFVVIIPARYASTRFPAKPLAVLGGKPVIQRVYEQSCKVFDNVFVATDNDLIFNCVQSFGGKAVMTSPNHKSGTDRCKEAYLKCGVKADVVINVQGDEPFIDPSQLETIKNCFLDPATQIATLVKPFDSDAPFSLIENPNSPKVVVDSNWNAMYFSRSPIPYLRGIEQKDWSAHHTFYKHLGLYAFRSQVLEQITEMPQSVLEKAESLEQLRWLEAGYNIKVGVTHIETVGIDTPEDLQKAELFLNSKNN